MNQNKPQYSACALKMVPSFPMKRFTRYFDPRHIRFQDDNVSNMYDHFMTLLDSRSSRMSCPKLLSLHLDYIGGKIVIIKMVFLCPMVL